MSAVAAVSVSVDTTLRSSVKRQLELIGSIGTAQIQQDIEKTILNVTKEQEEILQEQVGIESSLSDDIKDYLHRVLVKCKAPKEEKIRINNAVLRYFLYSQGTAGWAPEIAVRCFIFSCSFSLLIKMRKNVFGPRKRYPLSRCRDS